MANPLLQDLGSKSTHNSKADALSGLGRPLPSNLVKDSSAIIAKLHPMEQTDLHPQHIEPTVTIIDRTIRPRRSIALKVLLASTRAAARARQLRLRRRVVQVGRERWVYWVALDPERPLVCASAEEAHAALSSWPGFCVEDGCSDRTGSEEFTQGLRCLRDALECVTLSELGDTNQDFGFPSKLDNTDFDS